MQDDVTAIVGNYCTGKQNGATVAASLSQNGFGVIIYASIRSHSDLKYFDGLLPPALWASGGLDAIKSNTSA